MVSECCNMRIAIIEGPLFSINKNNNITCTFKAQCDGCDEIKEYEFNHERIKHLVISYVDGYVNLY